MSAVSVCIIIECVRKVRRWHLPTSKKEYNKKIKGS